VETNSAWESTATLHLLGSVRGARAPRRGEEGRGAGAYCVGTCTACYRLQAGCPLPTVPKQTPRDTIIKVHSTKTSQQVSEEGLISPSIHYQSSRRRASPFNHYTINNITKRIRVQKSIKKHKHNQNWPAENRRKTHRKEIEDKKVGLVAFFYNIGSGRKIGTIL